MIQTTILKTAFKVLSNRFVIIGLLIAAFVFTYVNFKSKLAETQAKLEISRNNEKAQEKGVEIWKDRYGQEHAKSIQFSETMNKLISKGEVRDSVTERMMTILKQQDVNYKKLERLMYTKSKVEVTLGKDVVIPTMPDTTIDLSNAYIQNVIHLSPTKVSADVKLENETVTTFTAKRVPVDPYKKTIVGRLFQKWFSKKHTLIEGETIQTNPLIETQSQKFIQVVK